MSEVENRSQIILSDNLVQQRAFSGVRRRDFLGMGLLSIMGSMLIPGRIFGKTSYEFLKGETGYLVESGQFRGNGLQCVGLLRVADSVTDTFMSQMKALREQHTFYATLTYRSTNRYKVPFAKDIISVFLGQPGVSLAIKIFRRSDYDFTISRHRYQVEKAQTGYNALIGSGKVTTSEVVTKKEAKWSPNEQLRQTYQSESKQGAGLRPVRFTSNDYLQLASFLVGCVFADQQKYLERSVKNEVKAEVLQYLKNQLGVATLSHASLANHTKIQIIP